METRTLTEERFEETLIMEQSFAALQAYFSPSHQRENASNPAQLVLFAEHALKNGHSTVASECIQLYFSLDPPANQFLIRAHLCEGLIAAPSNPSDEESWVKLQEALGCIVKGVNIAKKSECYHFLVYNASVQLWRVCRPFQRPGYYRLFAKALQTIVKALEECKEKDYAWRLELMMGLVRSQLDAGQKEEAAKTCASAAQLSRKRVPSKIVDVLKLQLYHHLGDGKLFEKEMKSSPEYAAVAKLYKVKCAIRQQSSSGSELEQKLHKVFAFITTCEDGSSGRKTGSSTPVSPLAVEARPALLLELASVCVEHHFTQLALQCMDALPRGGGEEVEGGVEAVQKEIIHCQLMVQQLGLGEENSYARSSVEVRLQAVGRMEEVVTSTLRLGDPELIQHASVVQWNLCLPLLHPDLRHHLRKPLSSVATALEHISSLLHSLRCSVHFELAKICADQNQLQTALEHLSKASSLDPHGECSGRVKSLQHRLLLRTQLYNTPEDPVDRAAKIIEQVRSSADKTTVPEDLRSILVKAGELLAPDCFKHTLARPTERNGRKLSHEQQLQEMGRKLKDYELMKQQVEEHAKDAVEQGKDKERCRLWADLAKVARKQSVWDVANAAGKFCLLYDDGRWTVQQKSEVKSETKLTERSISRRSSSLVQVESGRLSTTRSRSPFSSPIVAELGRLASQVEESSRRELLRTLAETHCLMAECLVYQLRQEGVGLGEQPAPPTTTTPEHDHWKMYCDWISQLSGNANSSFLRAAELGCSLGEAWLVCNAATYLWNYSCHWIEQNKSSKLVETFRPLLASIKQAQPHNEELLVCRVCTVLAGGLVQRWMPRPREPTTTIQGEGGREGGGEGGKKLGKQGSRGRVSTAKKGKGGRGEGGGEEQLQVDPEAGPELKEALEVCEYGLGVCARVPVADRGGLLGVWVQCKQLLQQLIPGKTFGVEEKAADSHTHHCRAIVAIEMISRMGNRIWDFPSCPTLQEVFSLLEGCEWDGEMVGVELWTRLASLALKQKEYAMVCQCAEKVLQKKEGRSYDDSTQQNMTKRELDCSRCAEWELLCLASSLLGQSLVASASGNVATTRRALEAFLDSARHGHRGGSYPRVMEACRHYWNACLPLAASALDRELLQHPLSELLSLVASLSGRRGKNQKKSSSPGTTSDSSATPTSSTEPDVKLLVAMYGLVFQAYADQQHWKEGLTAIEDAMWATPKAAHRFLAQHKLVFKSQMGKNVEGDMIRFQEEPEEFIAAQWYKAATNASNPVEQLKAYQKAIQTLKSPSHSWQKVEYLLEFGEWLYCHQFPMQDALDQFQEAVHILSTTASGGNESLGSLPPHSPSTPPILTSPTSVRQLEALVRVHVMMVEVCGRGAPQHQTHCLSALGYCCHIWKQTFDSFRKSSGGSRGGAGGCKLPTEAEEWATFVLTDELKEYIKNGTDMEQLSKTTIQKPMLLVHYLGVLVRELCACDLHPLALPALLLQLVTSECLMAEGSRPLRQLIHMRIAAVCTSLGLHSAAVTHSEGGVVHLNPEDLARSREEMEHHVAKKQVVEREESKRAQNKGSTRPPDQGTTVKKLYSLSDCVQLKEVWVQQAALLIKQGQYQASRNLLHEARLSSQTWGDSHTLVGALLGLGTLALAEGDTHKAASLLSEAQHHPSHWDSWLEGVLLLTEIMCREERKGSCHGPTRAVVEWALGMLVTVKERNRNEAARVEHAEAILKSRLAVHMVEELLSDTSATQVTSQVMKNCDVLSQCSRTLLQRGLHRDAAEVITQHACILRRVVLASDNRQIHQQNILQALSLSQQAAELLQSVYETAKSLCQPSEEVSLPVQRELVSVQLCMVDLLALVFAEHGHEKRAAKNTLQQKSSIEKVIDEFVRETPVLSLVGQKWQDTASSGMEKALAVLCSAHSLASNDRSLKAKCTYSIGHCLHLLSKCASPDPELQWREGECEGWRLGGEGRRLGGEGAPHSTLSTIMRREEASQAEVEESSSLCYLTQAVHSMTQAVTLALQNRDWELVMKASLEIVSCCGGFDPPTTSQYLALYQSCAVSQELCGLLRQAQSDPSSSQLAALLQQHSHLKQSTDTISAPAMSACNNQLETFESWRRLGVVETHLDLLKHFPSHFRFVLLQHSPDRSQLFAAYLVPPQPPPPAPKKGQPPPQIESLDPVVVRAGTSPGVLGSLLELVVNFQRAVAQKLSQHNEQQEGEQSDLDSQFADIRAAMEAYLSAATKPIATALRRESSDKELTVVLLADSSLLQLPLEALSFLHADNIHSVARDFSLQMLYYRIAKFAPEDSGEIPKDKKRGYQPQPATLLTDAASIKYVLDPRSDMKQDGQENPCSKIIGQIHAHAKLTSKWGGHVGTDRSISVGEWSPLLQTCSGLLFFGTERFLAHLPPARLAPLSLEGCSIVVLMDQMQTSGSALIQSKLDLHKSAVELRLESPLQTAMLLSLVGANCVVGNQWHTTVHTNLNRMTAMIQGLLSDSNTVGSLNWMDKRCGNKQARAECGDEHEADVPRSPSESKDTSTKETVSSDLWSLYSCVLYGLPHLTLVAQTTA